MYHFEELYFVKGLHIDYDKSIVLYMNSFGNSFKTQRELEIKSLEMTLRKFGSNASAEELSQKMFEHWRKSPIFRCCKFFNIM